MAQPTFAVTNDLNWSVSHRPLFFQRENGTTAECPNTVAVVRDDTERCLGFVSPDYETVQNSDLLKLVNPMIEEGLLTMKNVGYLNHGARVFAQAEVNEEFTVVGETYKGYITLLNGHVGNSSVAIGPSNVRVICGNTFAMAYKGIGERFRHQSGVNERVLNSTAVIDFVNEAMKKYAEYAEKLATTTCTTAQFTQVVEEVYGRPVTKMRDSFVDRLTRSFKSGLGTEGKTFYDAFNAITEYASNHSRKSATGRFQYANFGQGANVNRRALAVLNELATV